MPTPLIINGFEFYPEPFTPQPQRTGGGRPRRSLSGKGYQKNGTDKVFLPVSWTCANSDEHQLLKIIWEQARTTPLTITCADPVISGQFFITDERFNFERLEGDGAFYRGSLTFEEQ